MGGVRAVVDVVEPSGCPIQPLFPAGRQALTEREEALALLLALAQLPVLHLSEERRRGLTSQLAVKRTCTRDCMSPDQNPGHISIPDPSKLHEC